MKTKAYAAQTASTPLAPFIIDRREPGPKDVSIHIDYCGVCHSDLHTARGEWEGAKFPSVPGHEIVGRVVAVGAEVTKVTVGATVGVGCMVDSCKTCHSCSEGHEQYCVSDLGFTGTYNGRIFGGEENTYGGYAKSIVVDEHFVLSIQHDDKDLAAVAPLLCAGITTWSPLRHWQAGPGKKVGIVGIGGLGHMGVKLASALGAHVVAFTTSPSKVAEARGLGAHEVVISKDSEAMTQHLGSFDLILNTVSASHDLDAYVTLLKPDGTLTLLGAPAHPHPSPSIWPLLVGRRRIAGSAIGSIEETQEMLDFCAEKGITSEIETIPMEGINAAYERLLANDVKYRFVIDMATL